MEPYDMTRPGGMAATTARTSPRYSAESTPRGLQAQLLAHRLQAGDDVLDVLVERHAELDRALLELVARDLPGKAVVPELLGAGTDVELVETAVRADVR